LLLHHGNRRPRRRAAAARRVVLRPAGFAVPCWRREISWLDANGRRVHPMTFVVTEGCHVCKYTDCVVVCPVDCFYQDEKRLYINPDQCIDCCACCSECPVGAIFPEQEVPEKWAGYLQLNADRARALMDSGNITEKVEALNGPECKGPLPDNWMETGRQAPRR